MILIKKYIIQNASTYSTYQEQYQASVVTSRASCAASIARSIEITSPRSRNKKSRPANCYAGRDFVIFLEPYFVTARIKVATDMSMLVRVNHMLVLEEKKALRATLFLFST